MAWRKYFTTVPSQAQMSRKLEQMNRENGKAGTSHKFSSYLPEVYAGAPNRIERYVQYDQADLDSEINRALDTIAEFCTQNADDDDLVPFRLIYREDLTEHEMELLEDSLRQWSRINRFNQRIFKIFRNCIKYGDQFFIRDPETFELLWVDAAKVEKIIVNEAEGKQIEQYVIRDMDFNLQSLTATNPLVHDNYAFPGGYPRSSNPAAGAGNINYGQPTTPGGRTSRFYNPANSLNVDATHVVHLSLSEGMDQYWPFGISILEAVYKTYKQKDLLEDCILIYRIVRAPERRVFYIDVGQLQGQRAMAYVERVKNEIYQRRMPNRCLALDTKIYLLDGRLLPLRDVIQEHAQGKTNWVYSCCPETGKIVPGKITWAGATRSQTQVVRLTLDNGEQITCTPDHKFPILGKGFVEAQDLAIGESFIPAYFRQSPVTQSKKPNKPYTQVFDPHTKQWRFVHRMVAEYFTDFEGESRMVQEHTHVKKYAHLPKQTVHHKDFNRYNNNPENLAWMNSKDHICYHADAGQSWNQQLRNNPQARAYTSARETLKWKKFWSDPKNRKMALEARIIKYDAHLFDLMVRIVQAQPCVPSLRNCANLLSNNPLFLKSFKLINKDLKNPKKISQVTIANVMGILRTQHIHSYETFVNQYCGNLNPMDRTIYKFSDKIFQMFVDGYMRVPQVTVTQLAERMRLDPEFMTEFDRLHAQSRKSVYMCYAYVRCLLAHYGYPSFNHFKAAHPQVNRYQHARPGLNHYKFTPDMFKALRAEYENLKKNIHYTQKKVGFKRLYPALQKNPLFVQAFKQANPGATKAKFGPDLVKSLLKYQGFSTYEEFLEKEPYLNHKLVSIEWLSKPCDTGTITVDGDEIWHNYHTFAIEGGIFTKNSGGGTSIADTAYNPISITEDFFLATNTEQRGTRIESLAAGDNLGSIDDLKYFNNKLMRGLGIPSSYLPTGPDDGTAVYNDGKVGTAFIQEYRFNKYCQRLQNSVSPVLDREFKLFLKHRGITGITADQFELALNPPQSFSEYRKMALDAERANLFNTVMSGDAVKYLSKRWALERYLGLTPADILENEKQWKEENAKKVKDKTGMGVMDDTQVGLGAVGLKPSGMIDQLPEAPPEAAPGEEPPTPEAPVTPEPMGGAAPAGAPVTPPTT
jgi:hypothetical protein